MHWRCLFAVSAQSPESVFDCGLAPDQHWVSCRETQTCIVKQPNSFVNYITICSLVYQCAVFLSELLSCVVRGLQTDLVSEVLLRILGIYKLNVGNKSSHLTQAVALQYLFDVWYLSGLLMWRDSAKVM